MIKPKKIFFGIFYFFFFSLGAYSSDVSVFAEPYLVYTAGSFDLNPPTAANPAGEQMDMGTLNGLGFGTRFLVDYNDVIFLGPEFSYSSFKYSPSYQYIETLTGYGIDHMTDDYTIKMTVGLVAGIKLPVIPLRFWIGYNFYDHLRTNWFYWSSTQIYDHYVANFSGESFKLGAGYGFLPFLSANVEYMRSSYSSFLNETDNNRNNEVSGKTSSWMFSISARI